MSPLLIFHHTLAGEIGIKLNSFGFKKASKCLEFNCVNLLETYISVN